MMMPLLLIFIIFLLRKFRSETREKLKNNIFLVYLESVWEVNGDFRF